MASSEYSFEVGQKALYWAERTWRRAHNPAEYYKFVLPILEEKDPGLLVLNSRRVAFAEEPSLWKLASLSCYDIMRRQLDIDRPNFKLEDSDVLLYEHDIAELVEDSPRIENADIREIITNPEKFFKPTWITEKISRFGPNFQGYLGIGVSAALKGSILFNDSQMFFHVMLGFMDVSLPIIQKIERTKLDQQFPR